MKSFQEYKDSVLNEGLETFIVSFKMTDRNGKLDQAYTIPAYNEVEAAQKVIYSFLRNNYGPSIKKSDVEGKIKSEKDLNKMKIEVRKK